jgi:glycosyltransferase involved in cell wall biosynthesis
VLHAHELKAVVNSLIAASRARTKVRVTHTHTPISMWQVSESSKKVNILADSIFVNSLATTEIALTDISRDIKIQEGIKKSKLTVIPNGIDTERFDIPQNNAKYIEARFVPATIYPIALTFLKCQPYYRRKGHRVLIRASRIS